jgi:hypothetical protein
VARNLDEAEQLKEVKPATDDGDEKIGARAEGHSLRRK